MGEYHPESPVRLSTIQDQLLSSGLDLVLQHHDAPMATREQLCRVHDPAYVEQVFLKSSEQGYVAQRAARPVTRNNWSPLAGRSCASLRPRHL